MAQVDGAVVARSDRYQNQVILAQASTDLDAEAHPTLTLPAGLGDVLIAECQLRLTTFATVAASLFETGVAGVVQPPDGASVIDFIGVAEWVLTGGTFAAPTRVEAHFAPDTPVLWRESERVKFVYVEPDTNATPTVDSLILIRCLRMVSGSSGLVDPPLMLVRESETFRGGLADVGVVGRGIR